MNLHKHYLQSNTHELSESERRFDFIPNLTNQGAVAKSLNKLCYTKTSEIAQLKGLDKPSYKQEKILKDCRNYAILHQKQNDKSGV